MNSTGQMAAGAVAEVAVAATTFHGLAAADRLEVERTQRSHEYRCTSAIICLRSVENLLSAANTTRPPTAGDARKPISSDELEAEQIGAKRAEVQSMLQRNARRMAGQMSFVRQMSTSSSIRRKLTTAELELIEIDEKRLEVQHMMQRNRRRMMVKRLADAQAGALCNGPAKAPSVRDNLHDDHEDLASTPVRAMQSVQQQSCLNISLSPSHCRRYRMF